MIKGVLLFILVVAGGAWYFQHSLILVKRYDSYTHWTVLLLVLPATAGLLKRFLGTPIPLLSTLLGSLASAAILFPIYKTLWAVPPTIVDLVVYTLIIFGIGYLATQPIKTIFMMAFHLGRYSLSGIRAGANNNNNASGNNVKKKKQSATSLSTSKLKMTKTQKIPVKPRSDLIAMMELLIGVCSLGLSIFSVFFLGQS